MIENVNIKSLNNLDDIKSFIEGTNIKYLDVFKRTYPKVYTRFSTLKRYGKIDSSEKFPLTENLGIKPISSGTIDEILNYINSNNIKTLGELSIVNMPLLRYIRKVGIIDQIPLNISRKTYDHLNSLQDLQNYINKNNIVGKSYLRKYYSGLYLKFKKDIDENKITYTKLSFDSKEELLFAENLLKYDVNFINNFKINIDKTHFYRYDFLLPDQKIIIEVHGRQHFNENILKNAWNKLENIKEEDKKKRDFAIKCGYTVKYFTYCYKDLEKFKYFDKVYTEIDKLLNDIDIDISNPKEIDLINYLNESDKNKINDVFKYINKNKIISFVELKEKRPDLYWIVIKFKLQNKIEFCTNWNIFEINEYINNNKINSKVSLYYRFRNLHKWISKNNWFDQIKYYEEKEI